MYYVDTAILKAANIPDSIAWNNGEWVFSLSYPSQERKCRKCGNVGHYAKTCENKRETPSPSDENDSEGNSERDDKSVTSEISDVNSVGGSDMNGQNVGDVITTDGSDNKNDGKRKASTPNKEEPSKKTAFEDDALHNEQLSSTQERRVYHYSLPAGKTAPRVAIRKMCNTCGEREHVVEPSTGFYIAYCEKCDPLSLNATSKCFESACTVNKTWNKLPIDRERIKCANPKCTTVKYVCNCSNYHSVDTANTRYECDTCHECVDPPFY